MISHSSACSLQRLQQIEPSNGIQSVRLFRPLIMLVSCTVLGNIIQEQFINLYPRTNNIKPAIVIFYSFATFKILNLIFCITKNIHNSLNGLKFRTVPITGHCDNPSGPGTSLNSLTCCAIWEELVTTFLWKPLWLQSKDPLLQEKTCRAGRLEHVSKHNVGLRHVRLGKAEYWYRSDGADHIRKQVV